MLRAQVVGVIYLKIAIMGHISIDTIIFRDSKKVYRNMLGGPPSYASVVASKLDANAHIISVVGSDFPRSFLNFYEEMGIDLTSLRVADHANTTQFKLIYNGEQRELFLLSKCLPIEDIESPSDAILVAPIVDEIDESLLSAICATYDVAFIDPQGFFRTSSLGKVRVKPWGNYARYFKAFDVVKLSEIEAHSLLGSIDMKSLSLRLMKHVKSILVITLGSKGSLLGLRKDDRILLYKLPAYNTHAVDPTGAGDAFDAAFLISLLEDGDPLWACALGNAAASLIVERVGLREDFTGSLIRERASTIYESVKRLV